MMNLKILTDECLLAETKKYVRQERELLTVILHHLREIERRRCFGGHPSLYAYAETELGYSADQAQRRIEAMRLLKELPELEVKLREGHLNLSQLGYGHSLFQSEKKLGSPLSANQKMDVFEAMVGKTTRESHKVALTFSSQEIPWTRDSVKPLGGGRNLFAGEISDDAMALVERLKGMVAHKHPNISLGELLLKICPIAIEQFDPGKPTERRAKPGSKAQVRRDVWVRDDRKCTKCGSHYAVQTDHQIAKAMGGGHTFVNLRLLCRTCNQRAAVETFGVGKMSSFLDRDRPES